ncbi:hypothetical protein [Halothiobacillus sp.]|uniref:hypothetical protein n=1 Tax=Halothiobacillus sp. TaxID=1891311 RepID=UPI0026377AD2|nr:hypothetical protein [Halothiobacillus sp.]MDD3575984.1 hypothetical protein [Halothiobacillus sp.]MDD4966161.1 hypothetical protein [Halothiobacillus sp.]
MNNAYRAPLIALIFTAATLTACGGGSTTSAAIAQPDQTTSGVTAAKAPTESYISYLATNYAAYSETGTSHSPAASFDDANMSVRWAISTQTTEQANNLKSHIEFMENAILSGQNPRAWDKLFLMDAYMDQGHTYTTTISVNGTTVVIDKIAKSACAYELIKTHAQGVGGWFFHGDIQVSFSNLADQIIALPACDAERDGLNAYIAANQTALPKGITLIQPQ